MKRIYINNFIIIPTFIYDDIININFLIEFYILFNRINTTFSPLFIWH